MDSYDIQMAMEAAYDRIKADGRYEDNSLLENLDNAIEEFRQGNVHTDKN